MSMVLDVFYIREHHRLPEEYRFLFRFEGVKSVRAVLFSLWPGESEIPTGASFEEQERLCADYWSRGRTESVSWTDFEAALKEDEVTFEILGASHAADASELSLSLEGRLDSEFYHELFIRSESLHITGSDGTDYSLPAFLKLGEEYWNHFASKHEALKLKEMRNDLPGIIKE